MQSRLTMRRASALLLAMLFVGRGTTKMTDSPRAATEMQSGTVESSNQLKDT